MSKRILRPGLVDRLRSQRGESLVEVLVSILIASLSVAMLAIAVKVSSGVVIKSHELADRYYTTAAQLAERSGGTEGQLVVTGDLETGTTGTTKISWVYTGADSLPGSTLGGIAYCAE